jgi:hypothetical protein
MNQDPAELKKLLDEIEGLGLEDAPDPDAASGGDGDQDPDPDSLTAEQKAARAFAKQRVLLKTARNVIRNMSAPAAPAPSAQPAPAPTPSVADAAQRSQYLLLLLSNRAMSNVGIADPEHPVVKLEMQRLYNEEVQKAQQAQAAVAQAPVMLDKTLGEFPHLTVEDKVEISARVKRLDPSAQALPETIRSVVHLYIGENFERFAKGPRPPASDEPAVPASSPAAAATAASAARRGGVAPGGAAPAQAPVKAPNEQESRMMREIGLNPAEQEDVRTFREAKAKKARYAG